MPKTKIAPEDIPAILAMYAEHGGPWTAWQYGISRPYVYKLAHEHGVVSVVTRQKEEARQAKRVASAKTQGECKRREQRGAPGGKRAVLVCPGCFWAKGVGGRNICPRLGCGKVRRRET